MTGGIPPELGNLPKLEQALLDRNELTGSIPPELGGLANLHTLWLMGNELTGCVPRALADNSGLWIQTDALPPC